MVKANGAEAGATSCSTRTPPCPFQLKGQPHPACSIQGEPCSLNPKP